MAIAGALPKDEKVLLGLAGDDEGAKSVHHSGGLGGPRKGGDE